MVKRIIQPKSAVNSRRNLIGSFRGWLFMLLLVVCAEVFAAAIAYAGSETYADTNSIVREAAMQREAIYGASASPFARRLPWGRCTQKISGNVTKLYLHVFDWPADGQLLVPGLKSKVQKAYLLADRSQQKLGTKRVKDGVQVKLPANAVKGISSTVVLEIKGAVSVEAAPKIEVAASNTYQNETSQYGPQFAFDGDPDTRWATDDSTSQAWITVDLGNVRTIRGVRIKEAYAGRVQNYELQYRDGPNWKTFLSGATLNANFEVRFPAVEAREFRLNILSAKQGPTIQEIEWF